MFPFSLWEVESTVCIQHVFYVCRGNSRAIVRDIKNILCEYDLFFPAAGPTDTEQNTSKGMFIYCVYYSIASLFFCCVRLFVLELNNQNATESLLKIFMILGFNWSIPTYYCLSISQCFVCIHSDVTVVWDISSLTLLPPPLSPLLSLLSSPQTPPTYWQTEWNSWQRRSSLNCRCNCPHPQRRSVVRIWLS